ncbi:hypothetical protein D3C78_1566100 [compost metagenome]
MLRVTWPRKASNSAVLPLSCWLLSTITSCSRRSMAELEVALFRAVMSAPMLLSWASRAPPSPWFFRAVTSAASVLTWAWSSLLDACNWVLVFCCSVAWAMSWASSLSRSADGPKVACCCLYCSSSLLSNCLPWSCNLFSNCLICSFKASLSLITFD